ncbi:MAG TPA: ATP-dependent DNA helicase [Chitinophagaceae bacterium]|nr:ATP-dependent DNA helicase [Chitinophagaceae bacterium]
MKNQNENKFQEEYSKLNAEQKEAVDTIFGPVLVIAGPGTGKTQILAMRIAKLLQSDSQVSPQNILCLTFTDEGKKNMRDRLFRLIGAETAQQISVHTYHSFCNEIIQQNLSYFNSDNLELVSDLELLEILKKVALDVPKDNLLYSPKNPSKYIGVLKNAFQKINEENWSADYLIQQIETAIEQIKNDPESIAKKGKNSGNLKQSIIKEKLEPLAKSADTIRLFDQYRSLLLQKNRYDYNDMIHWVIDLLEKDNDILMGLQERYQYILVDEFQDTNGAQMKIIDLLTNYDASPNVFAVGDDDQSIFRFQGASVENMIQFQKKYKNAGLKEICLKVNYRSTQGILSLAKNLIEHSDQRIVTNNANLDKNLVSFKTKEFQEDSEPTLFSFKNKRHEQIFIAKNIQRLIADGVSPDEIAVLNFDNTSCLELSKYLKLINIPFYLKKNSDLLSEPLAIQVLNILRYIAGERLNPYSGDFLLFQILHYQFFDINAIDIAKKMISYNEFSAKNRSEKNSFRKYLVESALAENRKLFVENSNDILFETIFTLEKLIKESYSNSLLQLIETIIQEIKIIPNILKRDDKYESLEVLTGLIDFIKQESHTNPDMDISHLITQIDLLSENKIPIPCYKLYGNENSVKLFTIHSSKGREFQYVFLTGMTKKNWEGRRNPNLGIKLPENIFESKQSKKDNDELRRLVYVALTRAKKQLFVSYYHFDLKEKEDEKSLYLYEAFGEEFQGESISLDAETILEFETLQPTEKTRVQIKEIEKDFINHKLEKFELSVTALNNFLDCPLHFYYDNVLRIPSVMNENAAFGNAIHDSLEKLFSNMKAKGDIFPTLSEFEQYFLSFMKRNKEKFSQEGYEKKIQYGIDILKKIYETNIYKWHKAVSVELNLKAKYNQIPLKGFVDKIEYYDGNRVELIDYKTGSTNTDYFKKSMSSKDEDQKDNKGGNYWRQAMFYKILIDKDPTRHWDVSCARYEFLEPDPKTNQLPQPVIFSYKKEQIEQVETQIKEVWEKIQNHDFYTGCEKENCNYCNMAKMLGDTEN